MYCANCGKDNPEGAKFCAGCGAPLAGAAPVTPAAQPAPAAEPTPAAQPAAAPQEPGIVPAPTPTSTYAPASDQAPIVTYGYQPPAMSSNDRTLRMVAFIFCIVSCVAIGWMIIPLAWLIPMTVHTYGIYKGTKNNTTAFAVCTLLFSNLVAGILLLVSTKDA